MFRDLKLTPIVSARWMPPVPKPNMSKSNPWLPFTYSLRWSWSPSISKSYTLRHLWVFPSDLPISSTCYPVPKTRWLYLHFLFPIFVPAKVWIYSSLSLWLDSSLCGHLPPRYTCFPYTKPPYILLLTDFLQQQYFFDYQSPNVAPNKLYTPTYFPDVFRNPLFKGYNPNDLLLCSIDTVFNLNDFTYDVPLLSEGPSSSQTMLSCPKYLLFLLFKVMYSLL